MAYDRMRRMATEFADAFRGPSRGQLENDYLNRSVSITDLERRMGEIERGKFRTF